MAKQASEQKYEVQILSSDKDLLQLVNENTEVLFNNKGVKNLKRYNINNFFEYTGHNPNQVPDMKGIMGDSSDNLPGVKGIGEKGANKLILEYKTLENVFDNIDKITGSAQAKLIEHKEMALLCKKMATLKYDIELPFDLSGTKYRFRVTKELLDFFKKYELKSLINRYSKYLISDDNKNEKTAPKTESKYKNIVF